MPDLPILTVTLNPALDLSARVPLMEAGPKLRLSDVVLEPGGGGVNVARLIAALGGDVTAWLAIGGAAGAQHLALLQAMGVASLPFETPGETRANWAVTDDTGAQYRLQLPGPDWSATLEAAALESLLAIASGMVVLSGSQPPGMSAEFPRRLAQKLGAGRLVLDTSGAALEHVLGEASGLLHVLRLDQAEAEAQAGHALPTAADTTAFAAKLQARGVAHMIAVARGAEGNVLTTGAGAWHCQPPRVPVHSKIGAGDSFTGALTLALARDEPPARALQLGTAAAAATVMSTGTSLCTQDAVERLLPDCALTQLDLP